MTLDLPRVLTDYSYTYPESLIAYEPAPERTASRLLLVRKNPEKGLPRFEDCLFSDLPQVVVENPQLKKHLLVRNRSKVLPARFYAHRKTGSRHEIVLIEKVNKRDWRALIRHVFKVKNGEFLKIENSEESVELIEPGLIRFATDDVSGLMQKVGRMPLPPYIRREEKVEDKNRYQTVWAQGAALSAAAPTASLHFTEEIWDKVLSLGVQSADAYLHVGRGTFEALRETDLSKVQLHAEAFEVYAEELKKIQNAESVWAVGTTACRLVESIVHLNEKQDFMKSSQQYGEVLQGSTQLFIGPHYEFRKVQALLTNFHLPQSSLLVLVATFAASWTLAKEAYDHAVAKKYRLFSYGDASLWI